jgi:hypothetical protein
LSVAELRSDIVVVACGVSAGIHAALVPAHLHEALGAGLGFAAAAVVLTAVVVRLTRQPSSAPALVAAVVVLAGLLGSYALAITTGLPVLHPDPEPVDALALATKAVEAAGVLAAWSLLRRPVATTLPQPKGPLT